MRPRITAAQAGSTGAPATAAEFAHLLAVAAGHVGPQGRLIAVMRQLLHHHGFVLDLLAQCGQPGVLVAQPEHPEQKSAASKTSAVSRRITISCHPRQNSWCVAVETHPYSWPIGCTYSSPRVAESAIIATSPCVGISPCRRAPLLRELAQVLSHDNLEGPAAMAASHVFSATATAASRRCSCSFRCRDSRGGRGASHPKPAAPLTRSRDHATPAGHGRRSRPRRGDDRTTRCSAQLRRHGRHDSSKAG